MKQSPAEESQTAGPGSILLEVQGLLFAEWLAQEHAKLPPTRPDHQLIMLNTLAGSSSPWFQTRVSPSQAAFGKLMKGHLDLDGASCLLPEVGQKLPVLWEGGPGL